MIDSQSMRTFDRGTLGNILFSFGSGTYRPMTIATRSIRGITTISVKRLGWIVPTVFSLVAIAVAPLSAVRAETGLTAAQLSDLPRHFGFDPLEIFKIEDGITQMRFGDLNNDGRMDLVLANNKKSTIEVLLQRDSPPSEAEAGTAYSYVQV